MKTKTFSFLAIVTIALVATYNVYNSQKRVVLSDLAMANIEALATGEWNSPYRVCPCPSSPGNECKTSSEDRPTCASLTYCR